LISPDSIRLPYNNEFSDTLLDFNDLFGRLAMFTGKHVRLRPFEWEDAEKYRAWINDSQIVSLVDRVRPVTAEEHRRWYETIVKDPHCVIFAIEFRPKKRFVGCVWLYGIDQRHRHAEVRIVIGDKRYWGKGIGREAISSIVRFAFEKLDLHKVYAYVLATNPRAAEAFKRTGFFREGLLKAERYVNGEFADVLRFGLVRKD
jgi:RimJ/RimL family protein N-acetyltransferase